MKVYSIIEQTTGWCDEDYYFEDGVSSHSIFKKKEEADKKCEELNLQWLNDLDNWFAHSVISDFEGASKILGFNIDEDDSQEYAAKIASLCTKKKKLLLPYMRHKYHVYEQTVIE